MKWIEKVSTTPEASDAVSEMLTSIGAGGVAIEDPNDIRAEISRAGSLDYADDKFLSCAIAAKADFIISGDEHLLSLGEYRGIQIVTSSRFLGIVEDEMSGG